MKKTCWWHIAIALNFAACGATRAPAQAPPSPLLPQATSSAQKPVLVLQLGHSYEVKSIAFSPDGQRVASAGEGVIKLWGARDGALWREWTVDDSILCLSFSPDGQTLATAGYKNIVLLSPSSAARVLEDATSPRDRSRVTGLAWSPDGENLAAADSGRIRILEVKSGRLLHVLKWSEESWNGGADLLAWAPDGQSLVGYGTGGIFLWDAQNGKLRHKLSEQDSSHVVFSADGRRIVAADVNALREWDVDDGKLLHQSTLPSTRIAVATLSPGARFIARAYRHDSRRGASRATTEIKIWEKAGGRLVRSMVMGERSVSSSYPPRDRLVLSPDGTMVAIVEDSPFGFEVWDVATGRKRWTTAGGAFGKGAVAFSPDGSTLAVAGRGVLLWDVRSGRLSRTLASRSYDAGVPRFSADGKTIYTSVTPGSMMAEFTVPQAWDVATGRTRQVPETEKQREEFSPSRRLKVEPDKHKNLLIKDVKSGKTLSKIANVGGGHGHFDPPAWSPDGAWLAVPHGRAVGLYATRTGRLQHTLDGHPGGVVAIRFSPNGRWVGTRAHDDGAVRLWDVKNGRKTHELMRHAPTHGSFVFSPDSRRVAFPSNGEVGVWSVQSGAKEFGIPIGGRREARALFSADGRTLAVSVDSLWQLHSAANGRLRATLVSFPPQNRQMPSLDWLVSTPDGYYNASPGAEKFIRWRVGDKLFPAARYQSTFKRPDLVRKALQSP